MSTETAHKLDKKWRSDDVKAEENLDFSTFCLKPIILKGLTKAGFRTPSPVQLKSIPYAVFGEDLIIQAKSGTGKTCVFAIAALEILVNSPTLQVLILAPTREIAVQICGVINSIGSEIPCLECHMFIGGTKVSDDLKKLSNCQIAVGSVGRVKQLIEIGAMTLGCVRLFVLDEADNMLSSSFFEQLNYICNRLPGSKQVLALSATYPESLLDCVKKVMRKPKMIRVNEKELALKGIHQFYEVIRYHPINNIVYQSKFRVLLELLDKISFSQCLVYCRSIARVDNVCEHLNKNGHAAAKISSGDSQEMRLSAMTMLKDFQCRIMVSSDLTARGIDAEHVDLVINLDCPDTLETYLHRIGRAGRYGARAIAITFITTGQEEQKLSTFELDGNFEVLPLPSPIPWNLLTWSREMIKASGTRTLKRSLEEFISSPSLTDETNGNKVIEDVITDDPESNVMENGVNNGETCQTQEKETSEVIDQPESDSGGTSDGESDDNEPESNKSPSKRLRLSSECDDTKVFTDAADDEFTDVLEATSSNVVNENRVDEPVEKSRLLEGTSVSEDSMTNHDNGECISPEFCACGSSFLCPLPEENSKDLELLHDSFTSEHDNGDYEHTLVALTQNVEVQNSACSSETFTENKTDQIIEVVSGSVCEKTTKGSTIVNEENLISTPELTSDKIGNKTDQNIEEALNNSICKKETKVVDEENMISAPELTTSIMAEGYRNDLASASPLKEIEVLQHYCLDTKKGGAISEPELTKIVESLFPCKSVSTSPSYEDLVNDLEVVKKMQEDHAMVKPDQSHLDVNIVNQVTAHLASKKSEFANAVSGILRKGFPDEFGYHPSPSISAPSTNSNETSEQVLSIEKAPGVDSENFFDGKKSKQEFETAEEKPTDVKIELTDTQGRKSVYKFVRNEIPQHQEERVILFKTNERGVRRENKPINKGKSFFKSKAKGENGSSSSKTSDQDNFINYKSKLSPLPLTINETEPREHSEHTGSVDVLGKSQNKFTCLEPTSLATDTTFIKEDVIYKGRNDENENPSTAESLLHKLELKEKLLRFKKGEITNNTFAHSQHEKRNRLMSKTYLKQGKHVPERLENFGAQLNNSNLCSGEDSPSVHKRDSRKHVTTVHRQPHKNDHRRHSKVTRTDKTYFCGRDDFLANAANYHEKQRSSRIRKSARGMYDYSPCERSIDSCEKEEGYCQCEMEKSHCKNMYKNNYFERHREMKEWLCGACRSDGGCCIPGNRYHCRSCLYSAPCDFSCHSNHCFAIRGFLEPILPSNENCCRNSYRRQFCSYMYGPQYIPRRYECPLKCSTDGRHSFYNYDAGIELHEELVDYLNSRS